MIDILSSGGNNDHDKLDALPYYVVLWLVQAQRRSYSAPVVGASSITATLPFPSRRGTAKVVDRPQCDVHVIGRSPTLPSTAGAAVAVVVDGGGKLLKERLLLDSFC